MPNISVEATSRDKAALACKATVIAIPTLAAFGLFLEEPVRIKITETLEHVTAPCIASYNPANQEIQVLPIECLDAPSAPATAFSEMPAAILFESLIVHELTHAMIDHRPTDRIVPRIAHEYLAYAIQLESLPDTERRRILAKTAVPDPPDISRINEALLSFAPLYFAAASWLFFTAQGGDAAHVQSVLEGELLFDGLME